MILNYCQEEIIKKLLENKIVIFKTDTLYGFHSKTTLQNLTKINNIKNSQANKKLIILISKKTHLEKFNVNSMFFDKLVNLKMWPGKNSVILPTNDNQQTFCFRYPHSINLNCITNKVGPIYSTSCNITGRESLNNTKEINKQFPNILIFTSKKSLLISDIQTNNTPSLIWKFTNNNFVRER